MPKWQDALLLNMRDVIVWNIPILVNEHVIWEAGSDNVCYLLFSHFIHISLCSVSVGYICYVCHSNPGGSCCGLAAY
jgi:hypothetical protein